LCPVDFPALVPGCATSPACRDFCCVEFIADNVHRRRLTLPPCRDCCRVVGSRSGGPGGAVAAACGCLIGKRELAPASPCFLVVSLVSPVALPRLSCRCCRVPQRRLKRHSHPFRVPTGVLALEPFAQAQGRSAVLPHQGGSHQSASLRLAGFKTRRLAHMLDSLVRVSRRAEWKARKPTPRACRCTMARRMGARFVPRPPQQQNNGQHPARACADATACAGSHLASSGGPA